MNSYTLRIHCSIFLNTSHFLSLCEWMCVSLLVLQIVPTCFQPNGVSLLLRRIRFCYYLSQSHMSVFSLSLSLLLLIVYVLWVFLTPSIKLHFCVLFYVFPLGVSFFFFLSKKDSSCFSGSVFWFCWLYTWFLCLVYIYIYIFISGLLFVFFVGIVELCLLWL